MIYIHMKTCLVLLSGPPKSKDYDIGREGIRRYLEAVRTARSRYGFFGILKYHHQFTSLF
jgi:hypothetical protein